MSTELPHFLKLLGHDLRWRLVKALTTSDYRVAELVEQVAQPMNLVSYHLKQLRDDGVVATRRSEADGRDIYYSLDLNRIQVLYQAAGEALHPALVTATTPIMPAHQRVLFVCTHNSARSQMAEGFMRTMAGTQIEVASAGSQPTSLHADALATMHKFGIDISGQQAKALTEVEGQSFDTVITVCDRAREICPTFPGARHYLHWGLADPVAIVETDARRHAFNAIAVQLQNRIAYFLRGQAA